MRPHRRGLTVTGVLLAGVLTSVGAGMASAAAPSHFRTSAGTYTQHVTFGSKTITDTLVLTSAHTFSISGGGPAGTWSQPNLAGTIVMVGTDDGVAYTFTAPKFSDSLGSAGDQGTFTGNGQAVGSWYAVLTG